MPAFIKYLLLSLLFATIVADNSYQKVGSATASSYEGVGWDNYGCTWSDQEGTQLATSESSCNNAASTTSGHQSSGVNDQGTGLITSLTSNGGDDRSDDWTGTVDWMVPADGYTWNDAVTGKYVWKDYLDAHPAQACAAGTYSNAHSGRDCWQCLAGTYSSGTANPACTECPPGMSTQGNSGWASCTDCNPGFYAPNQGTANCLGCPAGQYSGHKQSSCSPCAAGYYCPQSGNSQYGGVEGTSQLQCPEGTTSKPGATSLSDCFPCPPGSSSNGPYPSPDGFPNCPLCGPGYFQPQKGQADCSTQPNGYISTNFYYPYPSFPPNTAQSQLSGGVNSIKVPEGFFSSGSGNSININSCNNGHNCPNSGTYNQPAEFTNSDCDSFVPSLVPYHDNMLTNYLTWTQGNRGTWSLYMNTNTSLSLWGWIEDYFNGPYQMCKANTPADYPYCHMALPSDTVNINPDYYASCYDTSTNGSFLLHYGFEGKTVCGFVNPIPIIPGYMLLEHLDNFDRSFLNNGGDWYMTVNNTQQCVGANFYTVIPSGVHASSPFDTTETPAGYFSLQGTPPLYCPDGTWSNPGAGAISACTVDLCSAEYVCTRGKRYPSHCSTTEYFDHTSLECLPCPDDSICFISNRYQCMNGHKVTPDACWFDQTTIVSSNPVSTMYSFNVDEFFTPNSDEIQLVQLYREQQASLPSPFIRVLYNSAISFK